MLPFLILKFIFVFLVTYGAAHPFATYRDSDVAARQLNTSTSSHCNATCASYATERLGCTTPYCTCTATYLQSQAACLLCQTVSPAEAASVKANLTDGMAQCRSNAILRRDQKAFLVLQIVGGHVGLGILLLFTIISGNARRNTIFLNFCVTWIFSSIVFSLLLYRGTDNQPIGSALGQVSHDSCVAQAALTGGAQVMTTFSTMALVAQLWMDLRISIHGEYITGLKPTFWLRIALLVPPYILLLGFAFPAVFSMFSVGPGDFYCSVELNRFVRTVYGLTLALLIITLMFDALIIRILYRHWLAFRYTKCKSPVSLSTLLRIMIFSIYRVVVAVAYGAVLTQAAGFSANGFSYSVARWVDMLQATMPLVAFLLFGIKDEMITSFFAWIRRKRTV